MYPINIITTDKVTLDMFIEKSKPEMLFNYLNYKTIFFQDQNENNYLSITKTENNSLDLYEYGMKSKILKHFLSPRFFLIQFREFDQLKKFFRKMQDMNILIDNGYKLFTVDKIASFNSYEDFIK